MSEKAKVNPVVVAVAGVAIVVGTVFGVRSALSASLRRSVHAEREAVADAQCSAAGKHPHAWRMTGAKPSQHDALAAQDGCSPLKRYEDLSGLYCCPPK